jgi:hypothetical protein
MFTSTTVVGRMLEAGREHCKHFSTVRVQMSCFRMTILATTASSRRVERFLKFYIFWSQIAKPSCRLSRFLIGALSLPSYSAYIKRKNRRKKRWTFHLRVYRCIRGNLRECDDRGVSRQCRREGPIARRRIPVLRKEQYCLKQVRKRWLLQNRFSWREEVRKLHCLRQRQQHNLCYARAPLQASTETIARAFSIAARPKGRLMLLHRWP